MNTSVSVQRFFRGPAVALSLLLVTVAVFRGQETPAPTSSAAPTPTLASMSGPSEKTDTAVSVSTPPPAEIDDKSGLRRLDVEIGTPIPREHASAPVLAAPTESPAPPTKSRRNRRAGSDHSRGNRNDERAGFMQDTFLGKGEEASSVIAVLGSATSEGTVRDQVVSVLGDSRVTGPVGHEVVAVLGNVYINSAVDGQVVSVLGDVELGPLADISGEIIIVGGTLKKDPAAITRASIHPVGHFSGLVGLRAWFNECVLYARPLALSAHLGWAWTIALALLLFYVLLAYLFRPGVERCVETLEQRPGGTVLTVLITILVTPFVGIILLLTVVGTFAVPFVGIGLFFAGLFGRAVMLAWIGRRFSKTLPLPLAVLIGGTIILALYLVPVLGFIVYLGLKLIGLGAVIFTLLLLSRREKTREVAPVRLIIAAAPLLSATRETGFTAGAAIDPALLPPEANGSPGMATDVPPMDSGPPHSPPPLFSTTNAPPFISAATLPRAGFWLRTAAVLIDVMLVAIVLGWVGRGNVFLCGMVIYAAVMWKLKATTVGGIICGLKVVRLDDRPIDWPTAIVRALSCILSLAVACLGFIWVAFDDQRQSWHDKIGGTVVVKVPKGISLV